MKCASPVGRGFSPGKSPALKSRPALLLTIVLAVSIAVSAAGQQAQTPTFRSAVSLVTIDVTVLDETGRPVPGLSAEDFEVKLNGMVQPVRAVAFVQASGTRRPSAGTAGAAPAPPPLPVGVRDGEPRVFVVLADDLSFEPSRGRKMLAAAQRFVRSLPPTDLVGFTTTSGVETVNPTPDRIAVTSGLSRVVGEFIDPRVPMPGQPIVGIIESLEIIEHQDTTRLKEVIARECFNNAISALDTQPVEVTIRDNDCAADVLSSARRVSSYARLTRERQLDRFLGVINSLRGLPGIKHLVVLSDGLPIVRNFADLEPVARAAAAAGVQLSVLVEEAETVNLADAGRQEETFRVNSGVASHRGSDGQMSLAGMQTVADITGGGFYRIVGSPDRAFAEVAVASSAVYRLGVEPLDNTAPGREFSVSARVKRPGLKVLANRHAIAPDPTAPPTNPVTAGTRPLSTEEQLRLAITGNEPRRDVPIRVGVARRRTSAAGDVSVALDVLVPASVPGPVSTMFGTIDASAPVRGGMVRLSPPADGGDYRAMFVLPLPPGTESVRFAAADATGAVGREETIVSATLDAVGPFTASDLLTSWVDAKQRSQFIALREIPPGAQALQAAIELYPPAGGAPSGSVNVLLSLTPKDPRRPALEADTLAESVEGVLRAGTVFEIGELPPGEYTLRAAVFIDGKPVGDKRTTLVKK